VHYDEAIALLAFDSNRVALWELHERLYPAPRGKRFAFAASHRPCPCTPGPTRTVRRPRRGLTAGRVARAGGRS
jgi:hypothetical protein